MTVKVSSSFSLSNVALQILFERPTQNRTPRAIFVFLPIPEDFDARHPQISNLR
jgi:hypothetical protein